MNSQTVTAILSLINKNGSTTTRDIQDELNLLYPQSRIYNSDIKIVVADMIQQGLITVIADNGTYRTYGIPVEFLTQKELCYKLADLEGETILIDFKDKLGVLNTDRNFVIGLMNVQGYREFTEDDNFKQLDPKRVKKIVHNNITYVLKSK